MFKTGHDSHVQEKAEKWKFQIGIHRGTLTSRDSGADQEFDSLAECHAEAGKAKANYAGMGYQIWFCRAVGPNGEKHTLLPSQPYR
jgi:hypothetical protein